MTDLGFGLSDRRTVLAILLTLLVSNSLLDLPMPVETSSVVDFALSFAIFVGFVYLCRVAWRIALTLTLFLLKLPFELPDGFRRYADDKSRLRKILAPFGYAANKTALLTVLMPLSARYEWMWGDDFFNRDIQPTIGILGVIDRLLVIGICIASCLPALCGWRQLLGTVGIIFLILLYVLKGSFTFVLKDSFQKEEEKHAELVSASSNPNISFPTTIATRPAGSDPYD